MGLGLKMVTVVFTVMAWSETFDKVISLTETVGSSTFGSMQPLLRMNRAKRRKIPGRK
jgi:hypothetical protein